MKIEELARLLVHEQHKGKLDDNETKAATEAIIGDHLKQSAKILEKNRAVLSDLGQLVIGKFVDLDSQDPDDMDSASHAELSVTDIKSVLDKLVR